MDLDALGKVIVDSAITVHRALGPGLLESAYLACLAFELQDRGLAVRVQVELPIVYRGVKLDVGYRIDLLVEEKVIVELKAVTRLHPIHAAQLLSHLRLSKRQLGFLFNFHEVRLKDGIKRMVNGFQN